MNMTIFKHLIITAIVIVFAAACKKNDNKKDNGTNVNFSLVTIVDSAKNYTQDTTIRNDVSISYLNAESNSPEMSFADSINKDFFAWISPFYFAEKQSLHLITKNNIKDAVASSIKKFIQNVSEDESLVDCETCKMAEFILDTVSLYQTGKIISIAYNFYHYSGGAHGYYGITAFNYDMQTTSRITPDNLSANIDELTAIAEKAFIRQHGDISDFNFDNNKFYLPKIFYFTEKGIVFYYSIYEIAPFAAGAITVELGYNEIKNIVEYIE